MKNQVLRVFGAAALAAGLMFAQTDSTATAPRPERGQFMANRAAKVLNLSTEQTASLQQIMANFRTAAQPLHQQLRADETALMTAARSGGDVTAAANAVGQDTAKLAALRAQAFGQFYGSLNAQQKQQVDNLGGMMHMFGAPGGFGFGRGAHAPAPTANQ